MTLLVIRELEGRVKHTGAFLQFPIPTCTALKGARRIPTVAMKFSSIERFRADLDIMNIKE